MVNILFCRFATKTVLSRDPETLFILSVLFQLGMISQDAIKGVPDQLTSRLVNETRT